VISRTGWSGELGFEIYPLSDADALTVWRAVRSSGESRSIQVAGPNLSRALEKSITDTHYFVNSDMDPYESGQGRLVDLDHGPFIGQEALRAAAASGPSRVTVGLLADDGVELPAMAEFWPVESPSGAPLGIVRWAAYSFALERPAALALLDAAVAPGDDVVIHLPQGGARAVVTALPLVDT
jgi:aminomethyltransferase